MTVIAETIALHMTQTKKLAHTKASCLTHSEHMTLVACQKRVNMDSIEAVKQDIETLD